MQQDRRTDRHRNRREQHLGRKSFVGVDGEGGNIDGRHEYLLLRAGNHALETGNPLTYRQCLPFLASLPKTAIYVSFFFDYDVTMICRHLPEQRLRRLLDIDCRRIKGRPCSSYPLDVDETWQIDYIPRKEFRVRWNGKPWTVIHDVGTFFQTSFVKALQKWFPEERFQPVIERIALGKEQRHDFGAVTQDEREYNKLEILMLEELMERFRDMCDALDIRPHRWQGPGNLVSAVFKRERVPRNKDITLFTLWPEVAGMANAAYYGGRFEVATFGEIT